MNVGIVGLGLIGGSLAKSIKHRTMHTVWADDIDPETMMFARLSGAIDGVLDEEKLADTDILLISVVPNVAVKWLTEHADKIAKKTIVVDMCGVKRTVCSAMAPIAEKHGFMYVGGHPMAGTERGGFVSSTNDLFDGASMILTPDEHSSAQILENLKNFFLDMGFGHITFSTPEEHDRIIAYTSQLAHVVSNAYIKSPEAQKRRGFSAGSFKDMTRVARLDEKMWTELFLDNPDYLVEQLEILIDNLNEYLDVIKKGDREKLQALLKDGREKKATAGGN